ncbi:recombinase family protein [Gilliamella sp. B3804]|nr:recombinase family protein [Gilliamella sp. B3804]MCX8592624.1 recombinase family protein [Gilliamella sp. B3804]
MRVSTHEQDLTRQEKIIEEAKKFNYFIAGIYKEKASGALNHSQRPALKKLIKSLQNGDIVMIEKMDRLTRLPFSEAKMLIETIRSKGASLYISNVPDLSGFYNDNLTTVQKVILDAVQDLLLDLALIQARDNYEDIKQRQAEGILIAKKNGKYKGRKKNIELHNKIINYRFSKNLTLKQISIRCECSLTTVKKVIKDHKEKVKNNLNLKAT